MRHTRASRWKAVIAASCLGIALMGVSVPAFGAAQSLEEETLRLVSAFPAEDSLQRDELASELLKLGPEAILQVCRLLRPPGPEDDAKARFALNGIVTYAARNGAETQRRVLIKALHRALEELEAADVRAFLIRQLQLVGGNESVKPLRRFLLDPRLCDPAAQALETIGTPEAKKALRASLGKAAGKCRVTLVRTLGELRSRKAVKKILEFTENPDPEMRRVALFALANIGDPRAEAVLSRVPVAASSYDRTRAPSLYLLYVERLMESGYRVQGTRICRRLIQNYTAPQDIHVACAALNLLVETWGERGIEDVFRAVESPSGELRQCALALAERLGGPEVTARWVEKMTRVPPESQAQIIAMLGRRGDVTALPSLKRMMRTGEKIVRLAAVPAVKRLGGPAVIPDLIDHLETEDAEEIAAVREALLGFPAAEVVPAAVEALEKGPPLSRAALIEVLAEKKARDAADNVLALSESDEPPVRRAALAALADVCGPKHLPQLIKKLLEATDPGEVRLLQDAVAGAANQIPEAEERARRLLDTMASLQGEKKILLLRPLPRIGGSQALETVVRETQSEVPRVRAVAVSVLSQWPDFEAAGHLLSIFRSAEEAKLFYPAVLGYVRLVAESGLDEQEKLARYRELLDTREESEARRPVFSGIARLATEAAFRLAVSYLDEPDLRSAAAEAAGRILINNEDIRDRLPRSEFRDIVHKSAGAVADETLRQRLDALLRDILLEEGFVPLFNGRNLEGWKGLVADPVRRARMSPEELAEAQAVADRRMRDHWKVVDGVLVFDGKGDNLCTVQDFGDFELLLDWKIEPGGDSGVYLRGAPQVQIWDPAQWPEGSGGLYNNTTGPSSPLQRADHPVGTWNTFRIKMIGDRVTVHLNGILVVDNVVMENYWERDKPIYPVGPIELQAHNTPLYFRNIYIREIPRENEKANPARSVCLSQDRSDSRRPEEGE